MAMPSTTSIRPIFIRPIRPLIYCHLSTMRSHCPDYLPNIGDRLNIGNISCGMPRVMTMRSTTTPVPILSIIRPTIRQLRQRHLQEQTGRPAELQPDLANGTLPAVSYLKGLAGRRASGWDWTRSVSSGLSIRLMLSRTPSGASTVILIRRKRWTLDHVQPPAEDRWDRARVPP